MLSVLIWIGREQLLEVGASKRIFQNGVWEQRRFVHDRQLPAVDLSGYLLMRQPLEGFTVAPALRLRVRALVFGAAGSAFASTFGLRELTTL